MQTEAEITLEDVVAAGRVLYGPAFAADGAGWRDSLKETYRRRAMETHPDRARSIGRSERELAREFKAVADAYQFLKTLSRGPLPRRGAKAGAPPAPRPQRTRPATDRAPRPPPKRASPAPSARVTGPRVRVGVRPDDMPRRRLRFAEYLYYSGRVAFGDLVDAIGWQRAQRPAFGRIAVEFGFLAPEDVPALLDMRRRAFAMGTPFGEWALRRGFLTPFQLLAIIGRQSRMQRPIGQFFVERGLLDEEDIAPVRARVLRHNSRYSSAG